MLYTRFRGEITFLIGPAAAKIDTGANCSRTDTPRLRIRILTQAYRPSSQEDASGPFLHFRRDYAGKEYIDRRKHRLDQAAILQAGI